MVTIQSRKSKLLNKQFTVTEIRSNKLQSKKSLYKLGDTEEDRNHFRIKDLAPIIKESRDKESISVIQKNIIKQQELYIKLQENFNKILEEKNLLLKENTKLKDELERQSTSVMTWETPDNINLRRKVEALEEKLR